MAGLDTSIYSMYQAPDIAGSFAKGIKLSDMIKESRDTDKKRQDESLLNMAMKNNLATNENGVDLNQSGYLAELAKTNPILAYKEKNRLGQQAAQKSQLDIDTRMKAYDYAAKTLPMITNQETYDAFLKQGEAMAPGFSQPFPQYYDPNFNSNFQNRMLNAKDKIDIEYKHRSLDLQERRLQQDAAGKAQDIQRKQEEAQQKQLDLKTPFGLANNAADAKVLKEAFETKESFDRKINEMIKLRKEKGVEYFDREAVARAQQLSKDALLAYKNMAKLGVLSQSDEKIINAIIPSDPLGQDWMPGQDSILHTLKEFKRDTDKDFQTQLRTRLRNEGGAVSTRPENSKPKKVMQNGFVYTLNEETGQYE